MNPIPHLWSSPHGYLHRDRLRREASELARSHALPLSADELSERFSRLRAKLTGKLRLAPENSPLDFQIHGEIQRTGYLIQRVSFASSPGIRVTGNLYVPEGGGPFPAVLNLHGHWKQGKVAAHVQSRGHLLALHGIVTLTVDAAGSGERSEGEREWSYHGAMKAAELFLGGDSLMAQQIRDNRRGVDVLQSLPFVDAEKIGATGASGGGNQTMWLAALDVRIKAAVPVVSVGSFESYVTERNCLCETLPGGLRIAEEWEVLGLIAPRPLLIMNALHDRSSFGYEAMSATCRQLQEVYSLRDARECLDWRLIDMTHGYHEAPLQAMLGWMRHWLAGAPGSSPQALPEWVDVPEDELMCYPPGERPGECGYRAVRRVRRLRCESVEPAGFARARAELARLIGWNPPQSGEWIAKRPRPDGTQAGAIFSSRDLPLPTVIRGDWPAAGGGVRLILSPSGKGREFVAKHWAEADEAGIFAVTADLPGVGELIWETEELPHAALHDTARACLWLGYTLVGEWAEAIAAICLVIRARAPHSRIEVIAEREAVFAALLCRALHPGADFDLREFDCPDSAGDPPTASLAWCVPGFLPWGDLPLLRRLGSAADGKM